MRVAFRDLDGEVSVEFFPDPNGPCPLSRRGFLRLLGSTAAASALPALPALAQQQAQQPDQVLYLNLKNANTGETLQTVFYRNGVVDEQALYRIDWFMRDWREGQAVQMNRRLYYLMSLYQYLCDWRRPMTVTSGYRTLKTNRMLVERGGAAVHSYHLYGMACDFFIPGIDMPRLRDIALGFQPGGIQGGVAYYQRQNFLHTDVGPPRRWGA